MFNFGMWEILIVLGVVLLLFGKRIPGVARSLGQSLLEFKKGMSAAQDEESSRPKEDSTLPPRNP